MNDRITLDYGSGGSKTSELIESILLPAFNNDALHSGMELFCPAVRSLYSQQTASSYPPGNFPEAISENFLSAEPSTICVWLGEYRNI